MHTHTGNPCSICAFPLTGMDAVNFLQGGIHPPQVFRIEKKEQVSHTINLTDFLKEYTNWLWRNEARATPNDYIWTIAGDYGMDEEKATEKLVDEFFKNRK